MIAVSAWMLGSGAMAVLGVVLLAAAAWRVHLCRRFSADPREALSRRSVDVWELAYGTLSILYAVLLGLWAAWVVAAADTVLMVGALIVACGTTVGLVTRNAPVPWIVGGQLAGLFAPLAFVLLGGVLAGGGLVALTVVAVLVAKAMGFRWMAGRQRSMMVRLVTACADASADNARLSAALESLPVGLCLFDANGRIEVVNAAFEQFFTVPEGRLRGTDFRALATVLRTSADITDADRDALLDCMADARERERRHEFSVRGPAGDPMSIAVSRRLRREGGFILLFEDVSERERSRATIERMRRFDRLTGLLEASQLEPLLREALAGRARTGGDAALVLFDLDGFKGTNQRHGRKAGDRLLQGCADTFRTHLGPDVVRLGGDKFAFVVAGRQAREAASHEADRLLDAMRAPIEIEGAEVRLGCSAGIAVAEGSDEVDALLARAEVALYAAKAAGRGRWRFFDPSMGEAVRRSRRIEADLPRAAARGELSLHFQPLVSLTEGRVSTCEALLRWNHERLGTVGPGEFVPIAERTGAIVAMGRFVIEEACRAAAGWPNDVRVAVNLSPRQFRDPHVVDTVRDALRVTGLEPSRLEVEITESAAVDDFDHTRRVMEEMRALGVRTALDDFGTGYSSLSHLGRLPFDKVKLDRSFVTGAQANERGLVLVRGITLMAAEMGLSVVVEGVELPGQLERILAQAAPHEVQGYLFARPLPEAEVVDLLERPSEDFTRTVERFGPEALREAA